MQELNYNDLKKVHFVGIGGIGMSALARMMLHDRKQVTGTNDQESPETLSDLLAAGVVIDFEKDITRIPEDVELIVYSTAWDQNEETFMEAVRALGKPIRTYSQALGMATKDHYTIAVAGTHGKTTTTAMLQTVLARDVNPRTIVGSLLSETGSNFVAGDAEHFLIEACEYKRGFLNIHPNILVITNIDDDHLDYFKDSFDIDHAFAELAENVPAEGYIVCDITDDRVRGVLKNARAGIINYRSHYDDTLSLAIPGVHNRLNAAVALAVAHVLGVDEVHGIAKLESFSGTWRRLEYKGKTANGVAVYDDYAHGPTEIRATLAGFRELFPNKKIIALFQPHLYSRTKLLFDDFVKSFDNADAVIIAPIYAAREEHDPSISHTLLADRITHAEVVSSLEEAATKTHTIADAESVIIIMGAGDVYHVSDMLVAS